MNSIVVDSSAVLRLLLQEKGADTMAHLLFSYLLLLSAVNYAEVVGKLNECNIPETQIASLLEEISITVVPFTEVQAFNCGLIKKKTKRLGLSLGDRSCLALAMEKKLSVYTADKIWAELKLKDISIHVL